MQSVTKVEQIENAIHAELKQLNRSIPVNRGNRDRLLALACDFEAAAAQIKRRIVEYNRRSMVPSADNDNERRDRSA